MILEPEDVQAIRDQVGGTRAMAERLDVTMRAVRQQCKRGVKRAKLAREIRGLVESQGSGAA